MAAIFSDNSLMSLIVAGAVSLLSASFSTVSLSMDSTCLPSTSIVSTSLNL